MSRILLLGCALLLWACADDDGGGDTTPDMTVAGGGGAAGGGVIGGGGGQAGGGGVAGGGGQAGGGGVAGGGGQAGGGGGGEAPPTCVDADQDGYGEGDTCRGPDCDDNEPNANPGALERCDGIDNDCDGQADEDLNGEDCALKQGVCAGSRRLCVDGAWAECISDDYGPNYEAEETLCDNLDNDCDGFIDEDCACEPGASQPCGQAEGECQQGLQRCNNGAWGACEGEVTPADETCDGRDNDCDGEIDEGLEAPNCGLNQGVCAGALKTCAGQGGWGACGAAEYGEAWAADEGAAHCDGLDNDCDGEIDEGCECNTGEERPCGSEVGACALGVQTCAMGAWGACRGEVTPVAEICDGVDNDCDGETDEGLEAPNCGLRQGVCAGATQACAGEAGWSACDAARYAEVNANFVEEEGVDHCDSLDNDCDGQIDEGCACVDGETQPCGQNAGECTQGTQTCALGVWGSCDGVGPTGEVCDGLDNDCDGEVDEEIEAPACANQEGVCSGARSACVDGEFIECGADQFGARYQADESRCDGVDNDCDGDVDEGCNCVDGSIQNCGSDVGACAPGTQTCAEGAWGPCQGAIVPVDEQCDGLDNDCDGEIDEDLIAAPCDIQVGVCAGAVHLCDGVAGWRLNCDAESYGERYVATETSALCDGVDNDCDNVIDEECDCVVGESISCSSDVGACQIGVMTCLEGGTYSECDGVLPTEEICDGLDNDCDGEVDEGLQPPLCPLQIGVCAGAVQRCGGEAGWLPCENDDYAFDYVPAEETAVLQSPSLCEGLDNDCDGETDEACPIPDVLISEVLYDGPGADGPNEFIELSSSNGAALGGLRLEAVNGSNGSVYWEYDFLPGDSIPPMGYFLITSDEASVPLQGIAHRVVPGADLQNGPDSLRLMWNGRVIDALAYGNFDAEEFPAGEGNPARDVSNLSLQRTGFGFDDTNDNATDFVPCDESGETTTGIPTPGGGIVPRLFLQLNWESDAHDMDLHMIRVGGEFNSGRDCYYGNRTPAWGPVVGGERQPWNPADPALLRDVSDGAVGEAIRYTYPFGFPYPCATPGSTDECPLDEACSEELSCLPLQSTLTYLVVVHAFTALEADEAVNVSLSVYDNGVEVLPASRPLRVNESYWAVAQITVDYSTATFSVSLVDEVSSEPIHHLTSR